LRGRTEEELNALIIAGIKNAKRRVTFETVSLETMALRHAIEIAREGDFIIALTDQVIDVVDVIHELQEKENMHEHPVSQSA
jgi:cyanophycin synthetase